MENGRPNVTYNRIQYRYLHLKHGQTGTAILRRGQFDAARRGEDGEAGQSRV